MNSADHRGITIIIPTRNEARALPKVLNSLPKWLDAVIVADYRSSDGTCEVARSAGAKVVNVDGPGYGLACLTGIDALPNETEIVVFLDGDASDDPGDLRFLIDPILRGEADFVLGSRVHGMRERGSLTLQQICGNWLACKLIELRWGMKFTDLGPFRAIRRDALSALSMSDRNYGWTVEMQVRAIKRRFKILEVPVRYRRRVGVSKVSGTFIGTLRAGAKILAVIGREAISR